MDSIYDIIDMQASIARVEETLKQLKHTYALYGAPRIESPEDAARYGWATRAEAEAAASLPCRYPTSHLVPYFGGWATRQVYGYYYLVDDLDCLWGKDGQIINADYAIRREQREREQTAKEATCQDGAK